MRISVVSSTGIIRNKKSSGTKTSATSLKRQRRISQKDRYNTSCLQHLRKEKKVVQHCLKYLYEVIWPINNVSLLSLGLDVETLLDNQSVDEVNYNTGLVDYSVIYESAAENEECHQVANHTETKASILKSPSIITKEKSIDYECSFCVKTFRSKSTFEAHLQTKRHTWKLRRTIEHIGYSKRQNDSTASLDALNESRLSTDSIVSSEEGYCTDSDDNKIAGPEIIPEVHSEPPLTTLTENRKNLEDENNNVVTTTITNNINTIDEKRESMSMDHHNENDAFGEDASNFTRSRKTTKERLKRRKMEELKGMYKNYATSRGSSDLYKTLLDSYADFDLEDGLNNNSPASQTSMNGQKGDGVKTAVSAISRRKYSVCEKEALMRRDLVLTELADTEKAYVEDLSFVINVYFPLMEKKDTSEGLKDNFEKIFGNIEEIYKFHSRIFLEEIEDCLEDPLLLNETFCKYEDELSTLYSQYCKCKPSADETLHIYGEEMDRIRRKYLPDKKLSIKDYLVKPVQRLMKYQLLLTTAKKYSERSGVNSMAVHEAIEVMDRVPKLANDAMHIELIHNYDGFLQSEDLLFQECLEVSVGKSNKSRAKEMRVFVFDSIVVFTDIISRKGRLSTYKCVASGQTNLMGVTETVENEPRKFAIWFRKFNSTDIYICQTETEEAKGAWIQILKDVIALQTILIHKSGQHTSLEKLDANRKREGVYRRSSRVKYVNDLVVGETLRQALHGHPRYFEMSERLKNNIERYILNELIMSADETKIKTTRSHSMIPLSSLVNASELKPSCRVRSMSTVEPPKCDPRKAKMTLVSSVSSMSFHQLDPR